MWLTPWMSTQRRPSVTRNLPVEIWEKIAFYACIDGGHAAYVLSLVCRNACLGTHWCALDIVAVSKARALRNLLRTLCTQDTNHGTQHLLVHLEHPLTNTCIPSTKPALELLGYTSSTLRSLVLLMSPGIYFSQLFLDPNITFPCLKSLSLSGNLTDLFQPAAHNLSVDSDSNQGSPCALPASQFPVLSSLHVSLNSPQSYLSIELTINRTTQLTRLLNCPRLIHLIISCLPRNSRAVHALCGALTSARVPGHDAMMGSRIRKVTIVFKPSQPSGASNPSTVAGLVDRACEWNNPFSIRGLVAKYFVTLRGAGPPISSHKALNLTKIRDTVKRACEDYGQNSDPNMQPWRVIVIDPDEPATSAPHTENDLQSNIAGLSGVVRAGAHAKVEQRPNTTAIWPVTTASPHYFAVWKERFLRAAIDD
jgi:hypothetical protein